MKIKFLEIGKYKNDIEVVEVTDLNKVYEIAEKNAIRYIEVKKAVSAEPSLSSKQETKQKIELKSKKDD